MFKKFLLFFCFFCFVISSSISQTNEGVPLNYLVKNQNLVINETLRPISSVIFEDSEGKQINLKDYYGKLVIVNFWATWCAPCKEEMPSLDALHQNSNFKNLEVLAVNMEKVNISKVKKFFNDLGINNLSIFFDKDFSFVKEFKLRGVPTTILINKNSEEFARIAGAFDFENKRLRRSKKESFVFIYSLYIVYIK